MTDLKVEKLNSSFSVIHADRERIVRIRNFLKVRIDKFDGVKYPARDNYVHFTKVLGGECIVVYNGHLGLLGSFGIESENNTSGITDDEIEQYLGGIELPFRPYDYQLNNIKLALRNKRMLFRSCTSSGKSFSISVILEFFRRHGMRGILIVPNINLLTQFLDDIKMYGFTDLANQTRLLGNGLKSDFTTCLTITTWQSMSKEVPNIERYNFDFIVCDEAHRMASCYTSDIILKSVNTPIKLGFTGTIPEDPVAKMTLLALFGKPVTIITSKQLIERGLGTPVHIKTLYINYPPDKRSEFKKIQNYGKQLDFIKSCEARNGIITQIAKKCSEKSENCLVLYQHTDHGKNILKELYKSKFGVELCDEFITGKKSFDFQSKYKILFMNGEQSGEIRELQRNFMENNTSVILVGNYACMSTGVNIKRLNTLIFASPLKSFTTISQSLGRLMRKHSDKDFSTVIDIVDNFGVRKPGGIFVSQYKYRVAHSYIPEEFEISEHYISLQHHI